MLLVAQIAAIFVRSHVRNENVEELAVDDYEEDEVRKAKRSAPSAAGQPGIDPRTEQVLREAFEPAPPSDPEPMPTTEWAPDEPLKPARIDRSERRRAAGVSPARSEDTHYHQEYTEEPADDPGTEAEAAEDEPVTRATSGADSYNHLRMLMVDLPIKAGTGEVDQNLQEVALATLNYYQYGLSQPGGDALPVGVTNGAQSSTQEDIAILAGYMDLEKRFGRVDNSLKTESAASQLMAALASRALQLGAAGTRSNGAFVREAVDACLGGRRVPAVGATNPSGGTDPDRLVYRRGTRRPPGSDT